MMKGARVLLVVGCLLAAGLAGRGEAATRYAWLDGARLFVVSSDAQALDQVHRKWAECAVPNGGTAAGIFVLDYDVVPPWNGLVRLGTFPALPRPSRSGEVVRLDEVELAFEDNAMVCVVLASEGYPISYEKGYPIQGVERFDEKEYFCFHAGTAENEKGQIVTNGGRVLGVTAKGRTLKEARDHAYAATEWISFENKYMRRDIGKSL